MSKTQDAGAAQAASRPTTPDEIMKALQAPFHPDDIEWRVGAKNAKENATQGIALAYVTNRAIMNRLDEVVGPFNWKNEYREWKGQSQLCGLSIRFEGEWITKWDGADDSDHEAVKGGLSDAMKRAGYQWGIGRYLYKLENVWVPIKAQGRSYVVAEEPQLPVWALPEGFEYPKKQNAGNGAGGRRSDASKNRNGQKSEGEITKADLEGLWSKCSGGLLNGFGDWYTKKAGERWTHAAMKASLEKKLAEKQQTA